MTGYTVNTRGRYKCEFCDHKTYKTVSGILTHVQGSHELELAKATAEALRAELQRERSKPPKVVEKERVVYRDPPKPKEPEYWYTNVFCVTCKHAFHTGIPKGYSIDNTRHSTCGTVALLPVIRNDL
jgi:hypothetical protein